MDNLFSFKRMGLLLRADWMENQRKVTYVVGTLLTCFVLYALFAHFVVGEYAKGAIFYTFSIIGLFLYFCQYVNRKIHVQSGSYLFVPANNEEKFVTLLLEGIFLLTSFTVLFILLSTILNLIAGNEEWYNVSLFQNVGEHNTAVFPLFIASLIFLSYMTFQKYPLLMVALGFLAFILLVTGVMYILTQVFDFHNFNSGSFDSSYFENVFNFLKNYFNTALLAFTVVTLYVAYLKLKEKELR